MSLAIDVHGLSKRFGSREVVRNISIVVREGQITGFLGPNGSGKTTTLRLLCGLLTPSGGEGTVLGLDFRRERDAVKRLTGYMAQKFSLYEDLTIEENLLFMARVHGLDRRGERVRGALRRLNLYDRRSRLAGTLSGGWKQRLALSVSTLHEPRLLLLDEPTAGVDPQARREFWDEIHALSSRGVTVLVSTHYMDEAERCHDIGYILNGSLIARGTREEIVSASGLCTRTAEGRGDAALLRALSACPGVLRASAFGPRIRVSGTDKALLRAALLEHRRDADGRLLNWRESPPGLEDVFIHLMRETEPARPEEEK
ncbi:MAG: ABC transporter ATP-binding protein [Deltaproteobacteria bacterium]|jgi:ABC-2 type transport system ATP-binding protein|nr:ABC transporter ATP-binding protein [Deltaproteobacteria bacterium]